MNPPLKICPLRPKPPAFPDFMIDDDFVKSLLSGREYLTVLHQKDCLTLACEPGSLVELSIHLRDEETFDLLVDLTAIDHGNDADVRFSVVLHLYSLIHKNYLRVHVDCSDNNTPVVPSVSSVFPAANWHERETFDMFGIQIFGPSKPQKNFNVG